MIRLSIPDIDSVDLQAMNTVVQSGHLVHGDECVALEEELAAYLGCRHALVVSSGTAALHLALLAAGVGQGDAVLVADFTFPATANVVELVGGQTVLVDVNPGTYNMNVKDLRQQILNLKDKLKFKAIIPVHEFGCPADLDSILEIAHEFGLRIVEDAACALGATYQNKKIGTLGDLGCFSFHPRKAITSGEGGAICINDDAMASFIRKMRNHGMEYTANGTSFVMAGFNYRLTNFQAALARNQLRRFDAIITQRNMLQKRYHGLLKDLPDVQLPDQVDGHAWQTYMVLLPERIDRARVISEMKNKGIECGLGAHAVHCQPYYQNKYPQNAKRLENSVAQRLYTHGLALPFHQNLKNNEINFIVDTLKGILSGA